MKQDSTLCSLQQALHSAYGMQTKPLGFLDASVFEMKKVGIGKVIADLNLNLLYGPDSCGIIHKRQV